MGEIQDTDEVPEAPACTTEIHASCAARGPGDTARSQSSRSLAWTPRRPSPGRAACCWQAHRPQATSSAEVDARSRVRSQSHAGLRFGHHGVLLWLTPLA